MTPAPKLRAVGLLLLGVAGCTPPPPTRPPQLGDILGSQWTLLPLPNSKITPGAVVQIAPATGNSGAVDILWLGSLDSSCQVPADILGIQSGIVPGLTSGTSVTVSADVGAAIAGVSLGAAGDVQKTSTLTINKASVNSINLISLDNWLQDPANGKAFQSRCGSILARPNMYAVEEAFVISDGTYAFRNTADAKLSVRPPPGVPVKAELGVGGGPTGDLRITQPVVFGLRRMAPLAGGSFTPPPAATATPAGAIPPQLAQPRAAGGAAPLAGKTVERVQWQQ